MNPSPHRCLLILLDGLGDRSFEQFDFKTPLQAAFTPNLDQLAQQGANGLFHATFAGQPLPSETAHFIMFGYDLAEFPGRGVLEALGEDISLKDDETVLLSHFVMLQADGNHFRLEEGIPILPEKEYKAFTKIIQHYTTGKIDIEFIPTGGIRGILKMRHNTSPTITDTDPFFNTQNLIEPIPLKGFESHQPTINTASALKEYLIWVHEQLEQHPLNRERRQKKLSPINGLVTQRAGQLKPSIPFQQKNGIKGLSISSGPMYKGLCRFINLDFVQGFSSKNPETELKERLKLAESSLNKYDFIHVHSKWPDKAAHTKDPLLKKQVIEALDRAIGPSLNRLKNDPETLIIISADHSTPSGGPLVHSGEPVPILFYGKGVRRDQVSTYDEVSAASGALGFIRGKEFMASVLNAINRAKLQGIMQTAGYSPVWTTDYLSFQRF